MASEIEKLTFDDEPEFEGYGAPEEVPFESIEALIAAIKADRFAVEVIEPLLAVVSYFWAKLRSGGVVPKYVQRGATYSGWQVVAELESYRDGTPDEAVPVGVILQFLMAVARRIK